ncbi:MAG: hypothetical protein FJY75_11860, partial [Candidatus Eisenbacteria bacterium]|nr:hypothetical protein [Candidatus Eisenbacteria bacterium]
MLRRAGLLLFGVLLGLCAAEGLARLYLAVVPPPADAPHVAHRDAGYLLAPDPPEHHAQEPDDHVNALGFRDREHARAKPPRTLRIAGIGDSFVYGSTSRLADHFLLVAASRLEERIRRGEGTAAGLREGGPSASTAVEMVLLGLGGYSPDNYVGVLRGIALPLQPDLVILNFYVGNDVTGLPLRGRVWHGRLYYTGSSYAWLDLLRRSRLFVLAERVVRGGSRARLVEFWLRRRG